MNAASVTGLAMAMLAIPAPVLAQDDDPGLDPAMQVGTRFLLEPESVDAQTARYLQKRIANCIYNRQEETVERLLANSDFYQIDYDAVGIAPDSLFDDLEMSHCMGRVMQGRYRELYMRFQHSTIRNLLAEEAYLATVDARSVSEDVADSEIPDRFGSRRVHRQVSQMAELTDCIVYGASGAADAILRSRPGSDEEMEAIGQMVPRFVECADSNEGLTVSPSLLRQMVADGLWARSTISSTGEGSEQ